MSAARQPNYYDKRSSMHRSLAQNLTNRAKHEGFIESRDSLPMYNVLLAHFKCIPQNTVKSMQASEAARIFVQSKEFLTRCAGHNYAGLVKIGADLPLTWNHIAIPLIAQELEVQEGTFFASLS